MVDRIGTCSCEQLQIICHGDPIRAAICHCHACQKRTGSVYGVQARFRKEQVEMKGERREYTRAGDSGGLITFSFCGNCGSTLWWNVHSLPEYVMVPVGNFCDPSFPPPVFSVYECRKPDWVPLPPNIEHMS